MRMLALSLCLCLTFCQTGYAVSQSATHLFFNSFALLVMSFTQTTVQAQGERSDEPERKPNSSELALCKPLARESNQ